MKWNGEPRELMKIFHTLVLHTVLSMRRTYRSAQYSALRGGWLKRLPLTLVALDLFLSTSTCISLGCHFSLLANSCYQSARLRITEYLLCNQRTTIQKWWRWKRLIVWHDWCIMFKLGFLGTLEIAHLPNPWIHLILLNSLLATERWASLPLIH